MLLPIAATTAVFSTTVLLSSIITATALLLSYAIFTSTQYSQLVVPLPLL